MLLVSLDFPWMLHLPSSLLAMSLSLLMLLPMVSMLLHATSLHKRFIGRFCTEFGNGVLNPGHKNVGQLKSSKMRLGNTNNNNNKLPLRVPLLHTRGRRPFCSIHSILALQKQIAERAWPTKRITT
jgi:hypothetical protein